MFGMGSRREKNFRRIVGRQRQAKNLVECGAIDRDRNLLVFSKIGQDPMLIGPPRREGRQIAKDLRRIGMEDVRTIAVDQMACPIDFVIGIAAEVGSAINQQHGLAKLAGQALRQHTACEPGADD